MNAQHAFTLQIDRKATQKRVIELLTTVRIYKQLGLIRRESKITSLYEPRVHSNTNQIGKPTETLAVYHADSEERLRVLSQRVEQALSQLSQKQREIITRRYLEDETAVDYLIWDEIGISERQYYRQKAEAFWKLAFMLQAEVYLTSTS
ncbi:ArpU family phage packaging/lysis transcriptional regulator [Brevibacillus dissolubilis]|uniref:ArpU family phage packaging/lysis transcriptional regulator n=1 Tax=Brevibacillus dissolubilis TaxID=1844116 RepID=UPI0011170063|nr:ArpU family phage packaging/lysis transcriptional regulator [Brevibacillus dissolubilis]